MRDLNKIQLIGRLGTDPTQRKTKNGTSVVHFSLATSHRVRGEEGLDEGFKEETVWHRIVVWGKLADICAQYLKKGEKVFVEGTGKTRKFMGKDSQYRYLFEVHAESVHFMGSGRSSRGIKPETSFLDSSAPQESGRGNGLDTDYAAEERVSEHSESRMEGEDCPVPCRPFQDRKHDGVAGPA